MNSKYLMSTSNVQDISNEIKAEALRLGFSACGIAKAEPVDEATANMYRSWLANGNNAGMKYLENNLDKRLDPTLLMPGAQSIICLAANYYPEKRLAEDQYQFAYYAYGQDYHDILKDKIRNLITTVFPEIASIKREASEEAMRERIRICVDTVPFLDRYWAVKAGLGWIGKNGNLIIPKAGSFFFLGAIIVDFELEYDKPMDNHCGSCHKCLDACPTGALRVPYYIDSAKCLSYLTIEHKGDILENQMVNGIRSNGKYIYGCDCCQLACPYNKTFATPTKIKEFTPKSEFLCMRPADWQQLTIEQYRSLFKGSAVKRAKYEDLMRNIKLLQSHCHQD